MQIVAINGSPRSGKYSKTFWLLDRFLQGCRSQGAQVHLINLREVDIQPCTGCYTCWTKTPGRCALKDDMPAVIERLNQADLEIWATPLYFFGPTGLFKNFLDRTVSMNEPFFVNRGGLCSHPHHRTPVPGKVFISVCGFPERDHFLPMSQWLHFMEGRGLGRIVAEIYRPAVEFLAAPPFQAKKEEILAACERAGGELVQKGMILPETLAVIEQDFIDQAAFITEGNKYWQWEQERWAKRAAEKQPQE